MRVRWLIPVLLAAALTAACDAVTVSTSGAPTPKEVDSYEVDGAVDRLVVRADAGSVEVRGTDRDQPPAVTEELHHDGQKPRTSHRTESGTVTLTATCPSRGQHRCWVDYMITVGRKAELVLDTGAGDIDVQDAAGAVEVSTGAGDVRAGGLAASSVTARSGAGGVQLGFVAPPEAVDAVASAGDVTVRLPDGAAYAVDAGTDVGEQVVDVPTASDAGHRVRARSEAGDVSVLPAA